MKIALDPYMHRHVPLLDVPEFVARLGCEYIELSPRADVLDRWVNPRIYPERIREFKRALKDNGVKIASLPPMYRWASPHPVERVAAMRYRKNAIRVAVEMDVDTMDTAKMVETAAPVLAHVHVADTFDHKASSGLRHIVNPPGSTARPPAPQHRRGRGRLGRGGQGSSRLMSSEMKRHVERYWPKAA